MKELIITCCVILILVAALLYFIAVEYKKNSQLKRYKYIDTGMSEAEMLRIIGDGYTKSSLRDNYHQYEWRIKSSSFGIIGLGMCTVSHEEEKKLVILTKNGYVEEIRPINV